MTRWVRRALLGCLPVLLALPAAGALADMPSSGPTLLSAPTEVPVGLSAGEVTDFDVDTSSGSQLVASVTSGDIDLHITSDDGTSDMQSTLSGPGNISVGLQTGGTGLAHLSLSSQGGATLTLTLQDGAQPLLPNVSGFSSSAQSFGQTVNSNSVSSNSVSSSSSSSTSTGSSSVSFSHTSISTSSSVSVTTN